MESQVSLDKNFFYDVVVYFIPGSAFLILFFLQDAEFFKCNIYNSLKLNTLLRECNGLTISSAIVGFIILFSLPYILGNIISILSNFLFRYRDKKWTENILEKSINGFSLSNSICDFAGKDKVTTDDFEFVYPHLLMQKSVKNGIIFNALEKYYRTYEFLKNISIVFILLLLIVLCYYLVHKTSFCNKIGCDSENQVLYCSLFQCSKHEDICNAIPCKENKEGETTAQQEVGENEEKQNGTGVMLYIILIYLVISIISILGAYNYRRKYILEILYAISKRTIKMKFQNKDII